MMFLGTLAAPAGAAILAPTHSSNLASHRFSVLLIQPSFCLQTDDTCSTMWE